jgi:hypothetical protein
VIELTEGVILWTTNYTHKLCGITFDSYAEGNKPSYLHEAESFLSRQQSFRLVKFCALYKTRRYVTF